jgi:hypothetical protein
MSLREVIAKVRNGEGNPEEDWLLIHGDAADLGLDTDCALSIVEFDENSDDLLEIIPSELRSRDLHSTIDYLTVKTSIEWADNLAGRQDDNAAADIIRYYIRFDAWPDRLNAPDPPPFDEILRRLDREFAEKLGAEDPSRNCRRNGCNRGVVKLSVFCRRHHFENIRNRPYPFDD